MKDSLDPTAFATAKLAVVLAVGLDDGLPKLAIRVANVMVCKYMYADNGGEAWPAIRRLAGDLGVTSERAVREALYALLERGHLTADRKPGETTRYRIADRYFEGCSKPNGAATQAHHEPGTQAHHEPGFFDTQAQIEPPPPGSS
jgi:hypothetical protein